MRPLKLTIAGFGPYADAQELDFEALGTSGLYLIAGDTGAGKTTIANLINRFYEIDSGEILMDGVDIRKVGRENLRSNIAMVLQDTHLFTGTIRENIRYGRLDATDAVVEQAANMAS